MHKRLPPWHCEMSIIYSNFHSSSFYRNSIWILKPSSFWILKSSWNWKSSKYRWFPIEGPSWYRSRSTSLKLTLPTPAPGLHSSLESEKSSFSAQPGLWTVDCMPLPRATTRLLRKMLLILSSHGAPNVAVRLTVNRLISRSFNHNLFRVALLAGGRNKLSAFWTL